MKFTIIVAEFQKSDSWFIFHVTAESQSDAERSAVDFADGETGCGPYEVIAVFDGTPTLLSESACGIHELTVHSSAHGIEKTTVKRGSNDAD